MPDNNSNVIKGVVAACAVVILVAAIVLPMTWSYVEYYEYGFIRQKSTGTVDLSKVYTTGRYLLGPDYEFKTFPADSQTLYLNDIDVFTQDKLEVEITVSLQYFLRKEELHLLHEKFDVYYEEVMKTSAVDALKGAIPVFTTRQIFSNRSDVEDVIYRAVSSRLGGVCCRPDCHSYKFACPDDCVPRHSCTPEQYGLNVDVRFFQFGSVKIPEDVTGRFMKSLLLQEEAVREELLQEAQVKRKNTTAQVAEIQNEAEEIRQNATAYSNLIKTIAQANYTVMIENARTFGLKQAFEYLGFTEQEHKNSFEYLRSLRGLDSAHFTVDFQQRIAGNL